MQEHTKIYADFFGYQIPEDFVCEICGCMAVDIHHIIARGMGGDPKKLRDKIENLMAMCRDHHDEYGDVRELETMLSLIHLKFIKYNGLAPKIIQLKPGIDTQIKNLETQIKEAS